MFWRQSRLKDTDVSPLLDIVSEDIFLSYQKITSENTSKYSR